MGARPRSRECSWSNYKSGRFEGAMWRASRGQLSLARKPNTTLPIGLSASVRANSFNFCSTLLAARSLQLRPHDARQSEPPVRVHAARARGHLCCSARVANGPAANNDNSSRRIIHKATGGYECASKAPVAAQDPHPKV